MSPKRIRRRTDNIIDIAIAVATHAVELNERTANQESKGMEKTYRGRRVIDDRRRTLYRSQDRTSNYSKKKHQTGAEVH